jgi:hypothetical protein
MLGTAELVEEISAGTDKIVKVKRINYFIDITSDIVVDFLLTYKNKFN